MVVRRQVLSSTSRVNITVDSQSQGWLTLGTLSLLVYQGNTSERKKTWLASVQGVPLSGCHSCYCKFFYPGTLRAPDFFFLSLSPLRVSAFCCCLLWKLQKPFYNARIYTQGNKKRSQRQGKQRPSTRSPDGCLPAFELFSWCSGTGHLWRQWELGAKCQLPQWLSFGRRSSLSGEWMISQERRVAVYR